MQSADNRDRVTVLLLLAASTLLAVLAKDFGLREDATQAASGSGKMLFAVAFAGCLIAVLMLLSPGKTHRPLPAALKAFWPQLTGLAALVIGYALMLEPLGFFIATSLFLAIGFILLGERRWWSLLLFSLPAAAALALMLQGIFGFALNDPLMQALGLIA